MFVRYVQYGILWGQGKDAPKGPTKNKRGSFWTVAARGPRNSVGFSRCCCLLFRLRVHKLSGDSTRGKKCIHYLVRANLSKVFSFITTLVGTGIAIAWAVLCYTYIVFQKARRELHIEDRVKEAESPFQPFLAWWGLIGTSIISTRTSMSDFANPKYFSKDSDFFSDLTRSTGLYRKNIGGLNSLLTSAYWLLSFFWDSPPNSSIGHSSLIGRKRLKRLRQTRRLRSKRRRRNWMNTCGRKDCTLSWICGEATWRVHLEVDVVRILYSFITLHTVSPIDQILHNPSSFPSSSRILDVIQ